MKIKRRRNNVASVFSLKTSVGVSRCRLTILFYFFNFFLATNGNFAHTRCVSQISRLANVETVGRERERQISESKKWQNIRVTIINRVDFCLFRSFQSTQRTERKNEWK